MKANKALSKTEAQRQANIAAEYDRIARGDDERWVRSALRSRSIRSDERIARR